MVDQDWDPTSKATRDLPAAKTTIRRDEPQNQMAQLLLMQRHRWENSPKAPELQPRRLGPVVGLGLQIALEFQDSR